MEVTFICLANSRKHGGRCVAGIRTDGGGWVRAGSRKSSGTLSATEYTLDDGQQASLLDVISIHVATPRPEPHQPENLVLGRDRWRLLDWILGTPEWKLTYRLESKEALATLAEYFEPGPELLGNQGDRVAYSNLTDVPAVASLALIKPSDVSWIIEESYAGKRQTRTKFRLSGKAYNLPVTDPVWEQRLSELPRGSHQNGAAGVESKDHLFFTISVGEPFYRSNSSGECFKLVAAVILVPALAKKNKERPASEERGR